MIDEHNIGKILSILREFVKQYDFPAVTLIMNQNHDPFKVLISTIISLRTKDSVTVAASNRLFSHASNAEQMLQLPTETIEKLIYPAGFYITKAKRIKQICKILIDKYNGLVPNDLNKLLELPGVGRKTANLVITEGFSGYGICVDTHVHRISNRMGFVKTKTPKETEFELRKKLPKKYWKEYNTILVAFGQNLCKPISPFCSKCPINQYCPKINVKNHR